MEGVYFVFVHESIVLCLFSTLRRLLRETLLLLVRRLHDQVRLSFGFVRV